FHAQHPDAFLLTAWNNKWLTADARFDDRHVHGLPENNDINGWLGQYLPDGSFLDIGEVPNPMTAAILREAHVGIFPNRCEGGTNLVAMECMAVGIPVVLACNTGHLDLINPEHCYPLLQQGPCMDPHTGHHLVDWGESSVDEIVDCLEMIYTSPSEARRRGMNGSDFIRKYSWQRQCDQLLDLLSIV
ncbi:MAG: glycosyltransferase, partial [Magnetococcus sp. YQC-5]